LGLGLVEDGEKTNERNRELPPLPGRRVGVNQTNHPTERQLSLPLKGRMPHWVGQS